MTYSDDPRLLVIENRLRRVKNIVPIMSSKGGVGKTLIATLMALLSAENGLRTGLFDLDITDPSAHIVLGIDPSKIQPIEEKGVIPPKIHGIKFMTVTYYSQENPIPLRGFEIDNVIRELLAITQWGELDILFIDTPPGLSDESLDVLTYLRNPKPIVVTTPSPLSMKSIEKLLTVLIEQGIDLLGIVENMVLTKTNNNIYSLCKKFNVKYIGRIPYDPEIDKAIGDINSIRNTLFYKYLKEIFKQIKEKLIYDESI
ncbi:MAG: ATP-binding protein [Thermoprotei archaeon]|nr:MAG: ATP-binding protein [Thermoprotei archaeon]